MEGAGRDDKDGEEDDLDKQADDDDIAACGPAAARGDDEGCSWRARMISGALLKHTAYCERAYRLLEGRRIARHLRQKPLSKTCGG